MIRNFATILLLFPIYLFGQQAFTFDGFIVDEESKPMDYVTVGLMDMSDTLIVIGSISDSLGYFSFKVKDVSDILSPTIKISFVGYQSISIPIDFGKEKEQINLGNLTLKIDDNLLDGVEITAKLPDYIRKADRLIVNLKDNSLVAGKSAIATLQFVPGIVLDNRDNIMLNGQSGVQVLINGEELMLDDVQLQTYLNSLAADEIESIELISNPSSKYSAESKAGILNIITKKKVVNGVSGNIFGSFSIGKHDNYRAGTTLNVKKNKVRLYAGYTFTSRLFLSEQNEERLYGLESVDQSKFVGESVQKGRNIIHFVNGGISYDINEKHSIGVKADGTVLNYSNPYRDSTNVFQSNSSVLDSSFTTYNDTKSPYQSVNSSINYDWQIDSLGKSMAYIGSFANIKDNSTSDLNLSYYSSLGQLNTEAINLKLINDRKYRIIGQKLDFYLPTKKPNLQFETGLKYSNVKTNSVFDFYNNNSGLELDPDRSSSFELNEQIIASYLTATLSAKETWSFQVGIRGEQTIASGRSGNTDTKNSYFDIFPTAFISKVLKKEGHSMGLSYGRRIDRPGFGNLDNLEIFQGPYLSIVGNPSLVPQYVNEIDFSYSIKAHNVSIGYSRSKNVITEFSEQDDATAIVTITPENLDFQNYYYLSVFSPFSVKNVWNINVSATYYFNQYISDFETFSFNSKQHSFYMTVYNEFYLPKKFTIDAFFLYTSPSNRGIQSFEGQFKFDMGISKLLFNDKLSISASVSDIFKTQKDIVTTVFDNQSAKSSQTYDSRKFSLSLSYSFAKGERFKARNGDFGNDGEINRTY